jgi:hypothetical protein
MKKCSTSLAIKEMQNKTTLRFQTGIFLMLRIPIKKQTPKEALSLVYVMDVPRNIK